MRLGRPGNETGEGLGMRLGRPGNETGNETGKAWE